MAVDGMASVIILLIVMKRLTDYKLKNLLNEGQFETPAGLSLEQVVDKIKNKTLIFFDTETTTLFPVDKYAMITEIAAVSYDTSTGERLGQYNAKAHLTEEALKRIQVEKARQEAGTWPKDKLTIEDLFAMTSYYEKSAPFMEEKDMMIEFVDFINSFQDKQPMMVAHNAVFDLYTIGKCLERHKLPRMNRYPVIDTRNLTRKYLFPILTALKDSDDQEVKNLLVKLRPGLKYVNRLGNLGDAFEISTKHWHSAIADTEQLAGILSAVIQFIDKRKMTKLPDPRIKDLSYRTPGYEANKKATAGKAAIAEALRQRRLRLL